MATVIGRGILFLTK